MRLFFTGAFLLFSLGALSQASEPLAKGHYIVVAVYRPGQETLAKKYTEHINQSGGHARYGYDTPQHYVYVYLDYYDDFRQSIREMLNTRKANGFEQAWVRVIKNDPVEKANAPAQQAVATKKIEPMPPPAVQPEAPGVSAKPLDPPIRTQPNGIVSSGIVEVKEPEEIKNPEEPKKEILTKQPITLANTKVFMRFLNPTNGRLIEGGEVEFVDSERSKLISTAKGNEYALIPDPKSTSGKLVLIGNTFGYRKVQHELGYKQFPGDTSELLTPYENSFMIDFEMIRYRKGDTETLYNVFFYNDAAIMLPESKYQLNQLLQMMKENLNYKIVLHGHTNGNAHGKIITMGPSKNFFALSDDVKEGVGSAKALSGRRAEVIKEWLVANGISADRIDAQAWGGSQMLHDRNSANAKKNVRVEVEVLED